MTTRRPDRVGRPRLSRSYSLTTVTAGPLAVRVQTRRRARTVSVAHTPSAVRPTLRWNSASATAVAGPKIPSTRPGSKPRRPSSRCSSATSSPRAYVEPRLSVRSPSSQLASTNVCQVTSSHTPLAGSPLAVWNAVTAAWVPSQ
jgi:hypothetical protein